jgi:3-deoxy-manno-octulosonate cytidylyltransferase (CMP-KDO synthetase)
MPKPKVIAVIPARYGSQRLPAKPLVDLLGKPMVRRVYEQASKASLVSRTIVATDDRRIVDAVSYFGGEAVLTSPDIANGSDRVAAVAREIDGEIFVNVQGDEPLIPPPMIDEAIRLLLEDPAAKVGTLAKRIESIEELLNPNVVKVVVDRKGRALYFSRSTIPHVRDEAAETKWLSRHTFYKHFGLYVYRREFLLAYAKLPSGLLEQAEKLEQLRILESGTDINVGITKHDSIAVDTAEDVERVVGILKSMTAEPVRKR